MVAVIADDEIRRLASTRHTEALVTTCYLDVDGAQHVRPVDVEAELERVARGARHRWSHHDGVTEDLRRIEAYVRAGLDRSRMRGLVMFACSAEGLWRVIPLPLRVRSRVVVSATPAVGQLEMVIQELARFGVLLADRQRARMFVFEGAELTDRTEMLEELPRAYDQRGHSDQGYDREQHHVEELTHQHLRHAADVAFALFQEVGFDHVVIGAPEAIAGELEAALHPYLRERWRGRLDVGVAASLDEIRRAVVAVQRQVERDADQAAVDRLRNAVGAGDRAVVGLGAVLRALRERRASEVLVSAGYSEPGWRCEPCDAVFERGRRCDGCGAEMTRVDDLVEEVVDQALSQGLKARLVVGSADLDVLGRVGAFLRY